MRDDEILIGCLLEQDALSLELAAAACRVEPDWLLQHLEAGLLNEVENVAGNWRLSGPALLRVRRLRQCESDFDAVPELAALVADLLEEIDQLRARLRHGGR